MDQKIKDALALLYTHTSASAVRNRLHARKANRNARPALARLLRALASSEAVHARRFLMYIRGRLGGTDTYLRTYLAEKTELLTKQYAPIAEFLRNTGKKPKAENFYQFTKVLMAQKAFLKRYVEAGERSVQEIYVCQICGFLIADHPPVNCPICNAITEKFLKIE